MSRFAQLHRSIAATVAAMAGGLVPLVAAIASTGGGDFPLLR